MDGFARLPGAERQVYFKEGAARLGLSAQIVEKDFWVCWVLRRVFSLAEFQDHLTFKGGTSLSKVYRVIERFSEDVDIAVEREFLGFGGENDPEQGGTGKEQQRRIDRLKDACQTMVSGSLLPQLQQSIAHVIGTEGWVLELDPADPDQQSLVFRYPAAVTELLSPYFASSVKLEFGARSDHFPVEYATVTPYLAEAVSEACSDDQVPVRVLTAARTFWEKATILHMLHHQPPGRKLTPRMSRHYYDFYQLSNSNVLDQALEAIDLLERVAVFKSVFFKAAWAKYSEARSGHLALVPQGGIVDDLSRDYLAMQPMFFNDSPEFEQILAHLPELERRINKANA